MTLRKWAVTPVYLSRTPLPPDKQKRGHEFDAVVNGTLVKCLQQLASVTQIANRIFDEIGAECRLVLDRAERIKIKIQVCEEAVQRLDAKAVRVPVSDIGAALKFLRNNKPYATHYELKNQLFLPSNRPPCIDKLYSEASPTPVAVMCTIDRYRTDGRTSSELFMVTPVLAGTRRKKRKMLDIETRKPANISLYKDEQETDEFGSEKENSMVLPSIANGTRSLDRLPSPEEQALAVSLDYPSSVVPVDVSGSSFSRLSKSRRSLIHADFEIKRKKSKHKSKRRHTVCEGSSKELERALQNSMVNSSCQTDDIEETGSLFSLRRSFSRRRGRAVLDHLRRKTIALESLDLDVPKKVTKNSDKELKSTKNQINDKKSSKPSLISRAANFNPISSLSAALSMAVKMRHSTRKMGKQDDGRSSSGNWSASSSTRASVDSDQHHTLISGDRVSANPSRNSAGKDSVLSDIAQESLKRSQDGLASNEGQFYKSSLNTHKVKEWESDTDKGRHSNTSTPEHVSDCGSTPLILSPYFNRKGVRTFHAFDDGESSVYSVDTDGYFTSMHTDSGLWKAFSGNKLEDGIHLDLFKHKHHEDSQSSVSTVGNSSINSLLSRTVTEISSDNSAQNKLVPLPPPRVSSFKTENEKEIPEANNESGMNENVTSVSPLPSKNGYASESDNDAIDRIRVKTTINSSRYPSMCAVSESETSDDELCHLRNKRSNVSVIVAEVHREESSDNVESHGGLPLNQFSRKSSNSALVNMYGSQSPVDSSFTFNVFKSSQITTSTPIYQSSVSTFASDPSSKNISNNAVNKELFPPHQSSTDNDNSLIISSPPVSPNDITPSIEKTLIPLKYAQRITVTPIVKSNVSNNEKQISFNDKSVPSSPKSTLIRDSYSKPSFILPDVKSRLIKKSSTLKEEPTYISYQSPDSPVSSSLLLSHNQRSPIVNSVSDKQNVQKKNIARVTLDPLGNVIYSSSSLDRPRTSQSQNNVSSNERNNYSTFPKYQGPSSLLSPKTTSSSPITYRSLSLENENKNIDCSLSSNSVREISSSKSSLPEPMKPTELNQKPLELNKKTLEPNQKVPLNEQSLTNVFPGSSPRDLFFRPSRGGRVCRTYFPSHILSANEKRFSSNDVSSVPKMPLNINSYANVKTISDKVPECSSPYSSNIHHHNLNNDAKFSGFPVYSVPTFQYRNNNYLHSRGTVVAGVVQEKNPQPNLSMPTFKVFPSQPVQGLLNRYVVNSRESSRDAVLSENVTNENYTEYSTNTGSSQKWNIDEYTKPKFPFVTSNPPDVIPSGASPPSTLDITSPSVRSRKERENFPTPEKKSQFSELSPKTGLTSSELFAIIHDSKKKHNIKTESEKSLSPLSSRSNSPAMGQTFLPVKNKVIETGVLTKAIDRPNKNSGLEQNSKISEKIGKAKPTSMHDFKMLLLQARVGNDNSYSKPSAAELLKVSPPKSNDSPSYQNSPVKYISNSPQIRQNYFQSGNSAVPFKRNVRNRSPYLTRYDSAYPPIWEDRLEDLESEIQDQNQNFSSKNAAEKSSYISDNANANEQVPSKVTSTWV